ncbi:MAG: hypothetical protein GC152_13975 [Alphaproteobacteria bacterium]|nr:hypothetical protein [Alphaproteobacteria bacterium]
MEIIADFLLLAASASACFYCYVLGDKLKKFKGTRNGIAASLASLTKSVDDAQTTIAHAHLAAEQSVEKLGPLLENAKVYEEKLRQELTAVEAALDAILAARSDAIRALIIDNANLTETLAGVDATSEYEDTADNQLNAGTEEEAPAKDLGEAARQEQISAAKPTASEFDVDLDDEDFEIEWNGSQEGKPERDIISIAGDVA